MYPPEDETYHPTAVARTMFIERVDRDVARAIVDRWLTTRTPPMRVAQLRVLGGAMARVPADATAFAHRASGSWSTSPRSTRARTTRRHGRPGSTGSSPPCNQGDDSAYVNFLVDEGEARVHAAYPGATWDRLAAIKARYDPDNLFHLNQNIPPAGS